MVFHSPIDENSENSDIVSKIQYTIQRHSQRIVTLFITAVYNQNFTPGSTG